MSLRFLLLFVAAMLTVTAYQSYRDGTMKLIWSSVRLRHVGLALLFLAIVILAMLLFSLVPGLDWGYIKALTGQQGSVYADPQPVKTGVIDRILPLWILVVLVLNIPSAVMAEEAMFRAKLGQWTWPRRVGMQLLFGLMHMVLGIPLFAALGLAVFGFLLSFRHLRQLRMGMRAERAVLDGASIHLSYNLILATFLLVGFVLVVIE